jgi:hypothetical protein
MLYKSITLSNVNPTSEHSLFNFFMDGIFESCDDPRIDRQEVGTWLAEVRENRTTETQPAVMLDVELSAETCTAIQEWSLVYYRSGRVEWCPPIGPYISYDITARHLWCDVEKALEWFDWLLAGETQKIDALPWKVEADKHCPVCGLEQNNYPWGIRGDCASYNICDCCGTEYGVYDQCPNYAIEFRDQWIADGYPWWRGTPPPNWNPQTQLRFVPTDLRHAWRSSS